MRRSRAERSFSVALSLFAIVLAIYLFLSSPFFHLETVYLSGSTRYSEEDVLAKTDLYFGQNLFDININEVAAQLQADPCIAQVIVRRKLPAGLSVVLEERQAVAVLSANSHLWRVDSEGRVLEEVEGPHSHVVIALQDFLPNVVLGEVIENTALRAAAAIAGALPIDLAAQISDIMAVSPEHIELTTRDGIQIRFGAWRDVPEKVRVLALLLKQIQSRESKAFKIDISVPSSPVVQ